MILSVSTMSAYLHYFAASCTKPRFFGLKPWYEYLNLVDDPVTGRCEVTGFNVLGRGDNSSFLLIALAILDNLLIIAAWIAVGYIIYGGIVYMTSQGAPDRTGKGQQTIINALIGLAVALIAVQIVSFVGNRLAP